MPYQANSISIGILGGGQLARMLCIQGQQLGFAMHVLSPCGNAPAAQVCGQWVKGNPSDERSIKSFIANLNYVTFESEFIDVQLLEKIGGRKFFPSLKHMGLFQNRDSQKKWLEKHKIKTASPFKKLNPNKTELEGLIKNYPKGFVLKERFGGYDGYGTYISSPQTPLRKAALSGLLQKSNQGLIVEPLISFKRELALSFFRSKSGDILCYPLVETFQRDHKCFWVKGPVQHKALKSFINKVKKALNASKYVGAIAFELFDTGTELIVNEIAPRVHNSAHYSLDAFFHNQFSLHLLAGVNRLPNTLGDPLNLGFAMVNIIGKSHKTKISLPNPIEGKLHWYGKMESRPGRKLGHISHVSPSSTQSLNTLLNTERNFKI